MQELEKIIKEIEAERADIDDSSSLKDRMLDRHWNNCLDAVVDIIKKHMNDDWIPVDERLPEKNEYFVETSSDKDFPNGYYKRLEVAYMTDIIEYVHGYYDGYKWMDKYLDTIENVVAWRIHEPYRPEGSDNHDGE